MEINVRCRGTGIRIQEITWAVIRWRNARPVPMIMRFISRALRPFSCMNIIESLVRLRTMLSCVFLAAALVSPIRAESAETRSAAALKAADEGYYAAFVSQSVPSFIELFKPVAVSVTMRNTGTAAWFRSEGDVFLATQEPQDNFYWCIQDNPHGIYSGNRVLLPHDVPPGAEVTFGFVVKPLSCRFAATAPFRFRVLSQMHGTFGEESPDPGIVISTASEFASQQVPDIAPAGAKVRVTVSFKNTTLTTWQPSDGYALGSAGPTANDDMGTVIDPAGRAGGRPAHWRRSRSSSTFRMSWRRITSNGR